MGKMSSSNIFAVQLHSLLTRLASCARTIPCICTKGIVVRRSLFRLYRIDATEMSFLAVHALSLASCKVISDIFRQSGFSPYRQSCSEAAILFP